MNTSSHFLAKLRFLYWRIGHRRLDALRQDIVTWTNLPENRDDPEIREIGDFLANNKPEFIPYPFTQSYHQKSTVIHQDDDLGLKYLNLGSKRLRWREGRKAKRIPRDYNALLAEQDPRSPHRYLTDTFTIEDGDVVVDVGSAEGILSLEVIERAGHVYLFEADERWVTALEATFQPWKQKVTIVPKFVGDKTEGKMIKLDDFFDKDQKIDFLKLDVEGYEAKVLNGCRELIKSGQVSKTAVCAYHNAKDEKELGDLLHTLGFSTEISSGYMLLYREEGLAPPYLRRGLLRANYTASAS